MQLANTLLYVSQWSSIGIVLFISLLAMTAAKPYPKPYMNYMDVLLLSNYIILCYMLSSGVHTQLVSRILIATPIAVLIVVTIFKSYMHMYAKLLTVSEQQEHLLQPG